jgi:hypothetical protein
MSEPMKEQNQMNEDYAKAGMQEEPGLEQVIDQHSHPSPEREGGAEMRVYTVKPSKAFGESIEDGNGKRLFSNLSRDEIALAIELLKIRDSASPPGDVLRRTFVEGANFASAKYEEHGQFPPKPLCLPNWEEIVRWADIEAQKRYPEAALRGVPQRSGEVKP